MKKTKKSFFGLGSEKSSKKDPKKGPQKPPFLAKTPKTPKRGGVQKRVIFQDSGAIFWP
jgi:hypothetical protein